MNRIKTLESKERYTFARKVGAEYGSDLFDDLGDVFGGRLILSSGEDSDPESAAFSGVFLAALAQALSDGNFWLANVLLGAVQYGIGEAGEFIRGVTFLSNHLATVGAYDRRARRGFQEVNSKPAYLLEFFDNTASTNLITTNPSFESNDFSGWTQSDSYAGAPNWAILSGGYDASYYAGFGLSSGAAAGNATIVGDKYATTVGQRYTFKIYVDYLNLASITIQAKWYDATPTLISTDTIFSASGTALTSGYSGGWPVGGWVEKVGTFVAPVGSTQVEIKVYGTFAGAQASNLSIDAASIIAMPEYAAIQLSDDGVHAINELKTVNVLGFPQSDLQFSTQYITSVTVAITNDANWRWGFYRAPTAANAADGDEYLYQFDLDAGTYTLYTYGATAAVCGIVDYYLDGTLISSGQDWYTAGAATRAEMSIASVIVSTGGRHIVKVKVNGKNASATDYIFANTAIWFNPATYTTEA